jgi:hypothetical protein
VCEAEARDYWAAVQQTHLIRIVKCGEPGMLGPRQKGGTTIMVRYIRMHHNRRTMSFCTALHVWQCVAAALG